MTVLIIDIFLVLYFLLLLESVLLLVKREFIVNQYAVDSSSGLIHLMLITSLVYIKRAYGVTRTTYVCMGIPNNIAQWCISQNILRLFGVLWW